ncbi:GxxExxY protein [Candidatus Falkowbacteria bacterium CG10_big_fil_rev_8_21_14_0_10_44_15]|uniref:GxxExxY protein n=1 Tax=Candidatus Falkowbacteria bacterium CG10_big_fil_rev_8_21_14_0_10_44_15 TaxID=1974569 RepID=A0A2H0UZD4_9BACT|nr:MAG: GxxExxY protein [Candidatus Falkowbacteria bacterium CG10_big_fil_rev_8_21_14_0_10_44_15]
MRQELIYKDLSYTIAGLLFEVHNELGRYCNEKQCADLFEGKLKEHGIAYEREKILPKFFTEENFGRNRIDFIIEDKIIIEFKCVRVLERREYYQIQRYLKALNKKLGLIVNFRDKYLKPKRVLNSAMK